jgi:NADH dehydrogenase
MATRKKVLIVGGGFAGLNAAKIFGKKGHDFDVTILDRHNYHLFQPLLYQVAMAGLSPGDIATPLRTELATYKNVRVLLAEAQSVDLAGRKVLTDIGPIDYDYLIMACGAQHSYFGHNEWEPFAPGLKSLEQATEIRRRVLLAFEMAEREDDPVHERQLLTFVIVGGGPTGCELAGTMGEITRFTLSRDFRHIDPRQARIILIEAGPRILPSFDPKLSQRAARDLENLGVTIWTNSRVTNIEEGAVTLGAEVLKAATILWAAGVAPAQINATLGAPLDRSGRVIVGPDLSLEKHPEVFVLGDQACFIEDGKPLPGLAPVAMQQGRAAARTILADLKGKKREVFHYVNKGQMATIGRSRAVAESGGFKFGGFLAWLTWLLVHIYYLVGFKNRVVVLFQWVWAYATFRRGAQLIVNKEWRMFPSVKVNAETAMPKPVSKPITS